MRTKKEHKGKDVVTVFGLRQHQPTPGISQVAVFYENCNNEAYRHQQPPP